MGIGHARNVASLDSGRLAIHSFRASKAGLTSSDVHTQRYISCPVSPIGSPLLHSRSPQHPNGRMSPSPISSPLATSGSSTPLTVGNGTVPFPHLKQPAYLQESFGNVSKFSGRIYINGPSHQDPNLDIFRGTQSGSLNLRDRAPCESEALGMASAKSAHGELYDGQSVLADRVSHQLLRDQVRLNPSLDLGHNSMLPSHSHCI